ncbi:uncharacterized protein LOC110108298 [Dendrobium catenatum]|uniref:uncharacterized protein LOC110108298 n=1 Tax=Dendrobium catenatum TaxID=906689 RepID=UPI0009F314C9|nr:uncharacterized protein LOC110108298 [Dendrobium catenatum]
MVDCRPVSTPLPTKLILKYIPGSAYERLEHYRQITGALQYLMITCPDLLYAINYLCQHMHSPLQSHYQLLKRVLRYVKGTLSLGLPIQPSSLVLTGFVDLDWATYHIDHHLITGYYTFLDNTLISWTVRKQSSIARSSTEAEYIALSIVACDII